MLSAADIRSRSTIDNHVHIICITRLDVSWVGNATAESHVIESGNLGVGVFAYLVADVYLAGHHHVALIQILIHIPIRFIALDGEVDLKHTADSQTVGHVDVFRVFANRNDSINMEYEILIVRIDGSHGFFHGHPTWHSSNLIGLRHTSHVIDWCHKLELLIPVLSVGSGRIEKGVVPTNAGEVGMEHPHDRL